jgi:hypothetical protein
MVTKLSKEYQNPRKFLKERFMLLETSVEHVPDVLQ